jgi:hypothetical protein
MSQTTILNFYAILMFIIRICSEHRISKKKPAEVVFLSNLASTIPMESFVQSSRANSTMFFRHDLINLRFAKKTPSSIFFKWPFLDRTGEILQKTH